MIQIKNQKKKMPAWKRLFAFFCILAGFGILSGCSRESEGTIYLSGTSMFKITVGSSSGTKDAEALNKTGKPLLEDLKWKGQPETEVLNALVQKMQGEEAKKIYIDVLGTDKGWVAGEIQKLSEFFSEDTYESTIPVEIRSASDLDGSKSSGISAFGEGAEEQRMSLAEESQTSGESGASEENRASESSAQDGMDGEPVSEADMTDESTEDESNPESSAASTTAEDSTAEPATTEPVTEEPSTARPAAATRAAVPKTTAPARTTAVPRTVTPETAAPATAAPETTVPETAASETASPETTASETEAPVPETAAQSTEGEALNSGNGEAAAATRSRNSDVYIPTKTIEDDQSFGPGW